MVIYEILFIERKTYFTVKESYGPLWPEPVTFLEKTRRVFAAWSSPKNLWPKVTKFISVHFGGV